MSTIEIIFIVVLLVVMGVSLAKKAFKLCIASICVLIALRFVRSLNIVDADIYAALSPAIFRLLSGLAQVIRMITGFINNAIKLSM